MLSKVEHYCDATVSALFAPKILAMQNMHEKEIYCVNQNDVESNIHI